MKNKKLTITIGIPAFNEEANIGYLLSSLLTQRTKGFTIGKIIIVSDGSTDRTDEIVKKFKNRGVSLEVNTNRSGQAISQNRIIKGCKSEALVLLNADIAIVGRYFINNMVSPIFKDNADLISSALGAVKPDKATEKIIHAGLKIRMYMFDRYKNGQSVHTCFGVARAFSKRFYKRFRFKGSVSEDAYSYFSCKKLGYKYLHVNNAVALIKLPDNLKDHERQSLRNVRGKRLLAKEFGKPFVEEEYKGINFFFNMPFSLIARGVIRSMLLSPGYTLAYLGVQFWIRLKSLGVGQTEDTWEMAKSSKSLHKSKI